MRYSIVIPVFNKVEFTRQCLNALPRTLSGAGESEVIVVDNGSSDETAQALEQYPWIRLVRNERNLGFAVACNQGARAANGEFVIHLNNDIVPSSGWAAAMLAAATKDVGVVGAKLLFPDGKIQHAGVVMTPSRFGIEGFAPYHYLYKLPGDYPYANVKRDLQAVTGACLLTPRELFLRLGGFDETFWNGYEDVDYCLKMRALGLRVVYEPKATLIHYESQSGIERRRRVIYNIAQLAERWAGRVEIDENRYFPQMGAIRREMCLAYGARKLVVEPLPPVSIFVHGPAPHDADAFVAGLLAGAFPLEELIWNVDGPRPARLPPDVNVRVLGGDPIAAARAIMERRGDRFLAFVDSRAKLSPGWMNELIRQIEWGYDVAAVTFAPELGLAEETAPLSADARCTMLSMQCFPQEERLETFTTLGGALAAFLLRAQVMGKGVRGVALSLGELPPLAPDEAFGAKFGAPIAAFLKDDPQALEVFIRANRHAPAAGLATIVMLSWNAVQYTKVAMQSIRSQTKHPYEIVIVDNGSREETLEYLRTIEGDEDVSIIYNKENKGFAHGCNQGIAAARGDFVVLLNNDVAVTEGWLGNLIGAFDRIPGLGVAAPRSNNVAGDQRVSDARYADLEGMTMYAVMRRQHYRHSGYLTDRAIGFCLCIRRSVLEEIGGIDERYGIGNFEDDDFCVRVRAAGYKIFVCDDVFIHHAGSATFTENNVNYSSTMLANWQKFAAKWGLPREYPQNGYTGRSAIRAGFRRDDHYVALPVFTQPLGDSEARLIVALAVTSERDWDDVGAFVRKFVEAFDLASGIVLAIAASGSIDAAVIGARVEKYAARSGRDLDQIADVLISDEADLAAWIAGLPHGPRVCVGAVLEAAGGIEVLRDKSPSGVRRYLQSRAATLV